jgi:hypothetical protein
MMSNVERYQRIAPLYDLLDLPFERRRYQALRPLMFKDLGGQLLDAGIGTGRNCAYYRRMPTYRGSILALPCSNERESGVRP